MGDTSEEEYNDLDFEMWYNDLKSLAELHNESVDDFDAWREDFDNNLTVEQSFYSEFPEYNQKKDLYNEL